MAGETLFEVGAGLDGDQGRAGGGLPLGLVGAVAAGGVKGWDPHLSAGVAFDGVEDNWGVDDVFDVVGVVGVVGVVALGVLAPENSGPPVACQHTPMQK